MITVTALLHLQHQARLVCVEQLECPKSTYRTQLHSLKRQLQPIFGQWAHSLRDGSHHMHLRLLAFMD